MYLRKFLPFSSFLQKRREGLRVESILERVRGVGGVGSYKQPKKSEVRELRVKYDQI